MRRIDASPPLVLPAAKTYTGCVDEPTQEPLKETELGAFIKFRGDRPAPRPFRRYERQPWHPASVLPLQSEAIDFLNAAWVEHKLPRAQIEAAMELALSVFEDRDIAKEWLNEPNLATDNKPPIALLGSDEGFSRVQTLLHRIEYGVLA